MSIHDQPDISSTTGRPPEQLPLPFDLAAILGNVFRQSLSPPPAAPPPDSSRAFETVLDMMQTTNRTLIRLLEEERAEKRDLQRRCEKLQQLLTVAQSASSQAATTVTPEPHFDRHIPF